MNRRPRLAVFRSSQYIYGQIIDDKKGITLVSAHDGDLKTKKKVSKTKRAGLVGEILAKRAKELGIRKIRFDRRKYLYHGRVKALAEGARKGGLKF